MLAALAAGFPGALRIVGKIAAPAHLPALLIRLAALATLRLAAMRCLAAFLAGLAGALAVVSEIASSLVCHVNPPVAGVMSMKRRGKPIVPEI